MSETHTDRGELEGRHLPSMTLTMSDDEPVVMCSRERDLDAALVAADDMGLLIAITRSLVEKLRCGPEIAGPAEEQHLEDLDE